MSGQEGDSSGSVEAAATPSQDLHREKPASTVVRVLTVLAYLLSVSLAAILLSIYYICVWKSPDLKELNEINMLSARRGDHHDYDPGLQDSTPYNYLGGSNTQVNQTATPPTLDNYTNDMNINETIVEGTLYYNENSTLSANEQDNETSTDDAIDVTTDT